MAVRVAPRELKPSTLRMQGLSARLIDEHYHILYKGYVNKLNEVRAKLDLANRTTVSQTYSEFRELKVEESFALNAVRLHELYFENLGGPGGQPADVLAELVARDFGSYAAWEEDCKACAAAARGWMLLAYDLNDARLCNYVADAHNAQGIWGAVPLLVLDTYEHAYAIDYGARRAPYVEAFLRNVDWSVASMRLAAVLPSTENTNSEPASG